MEKECYGVILAAGQGTRMKSKLYKVLHEIAGKPMVEHVISQVEQLHPAQIVTVVGHGAEEVKHHLGDRSAYVLQEEQKGTGHAVLQSKSLLQNKSGTTIVLCGDTPLLTADTLKKLLDYHQEKGAKATILTAKADHPAGYGRIIRDDLGIVQKIVEEKDASPEEKLVTEINTGTFCFDNQTLFAALDEIRPNNAQGEYYITDVIEIIKRAGGIIAAYRMKDFAESMGVNDRAALAKATQVMRERINQKHMLGGVTFIDPATTYIDVDVQIGADSIIEGNVTIKGHSTIGEDCYISTSSVIIDSHLEAGVKVTSSHIERATIGKSSDVGPFGRIRPGSSIGASVHIGNFVEIKNAVIGDGTKCGHLSYVGDATLGKDINVGCGVVFVNYDGKEKHHIEVGDSSFIGSNANIVAPLTLGKDSFVAAGSTITKDVPEAALGVARSRQVNKEGYAARLPYFKNNH